MGEEDPVVACRKRQNVRIPESRQIGCGGRPNVDFRMPAATALTMI
jgi:hypothetical protein